MADRIVVMRDGHIEQQGAPLAIYDEPETRFVAGFIGSPAMNFIRAHVVNGRVDLGAGGHIALPPHLAFVQGEVELGIRPEHLVVDGTGPLQGRIQVIEATGSETLLYVDCDGHRLCILMRERAHCKVGDELRMSLKSSILVFDPQTGKRIRA